MATTAVLENVQEQVAALEAEVSELKGRLADEQKDLAALEQEQTRVGERIVLGQGKPSKAGEIARHIEQVGARYSGLRSILARKQAELDQLWPERRRLEAEATLARRRSELEALTKRGREHVAALNEKLAALITSDLLELDRIRDSMMQYKDIGGQKAGASLCVTLIDGNGALKEEQKLTDNDWHRNPSMWKIRGDVVLTLRNLWPPKSEVPMHSHERQTAAIVAEKELADVDSLQAEGLEIVSRIAANIARYQEVRRQLRAKSSTFSGQLGMEARCAINQMNQTLSEQLTRFR